MPRPTTAQAAYGLLTVVLSTFAMLLLSGARSGAGVVAIAAAGLVLGLLAAFAVELRNRRVAADSAADSPAVPAASAAQMSRPRAASGAAEVRVTEHSLRS